MLRVLCHSIGVCMMVGLFSLLPVVLGLSLPILSSNSHAGPVVAVPSIAVQDPQDNAPATQKLRQGYEALARRDHTTANALFREAVRLSPHSPLPLLALAETARVRNEGDLVEKWLGEALRVAPKDSTTLSAWGSWHYARGDYQKAESFKKAATAADPKATGPLVDLGDLYFNVLGEPEQAADFYRRALAINPDLGGAHYALGMTLQSGAKLDAAIAEFKASARLSPENPLPLQALARALAQKGDSAGALATLDQLLKMQPAYAPALVDKGDVLFSQGRTDAALVEYSAAVRANPRVALVHMKLGMTQQALNRAVEAITSYKTAIRLDPKQAIALNNLAWLSAERADIADRGLAWAKQAVALNGAEPRFQGTLAWVYFKRGETANALRILEPLVASAGKGLPESHYLLGLVYAETGVRAKAVPALREALRLNPAFSQATDAKARLLRLEAS